MKLDFTIEGDWHTIPDVTRIADFIEGGLEAVGVVGEGKECDLKPGSRMTASVVREPKKAGAR